MVKQNLANRLAAGGFWALCMARETLDAAREMRERGYPLPFPGAEHDQTVYSLCGAEAFKWFINVTLDGMKMTLGTERPIPLTQTPQQKYDRTNAPISHTLWEELQARPGYRDVGKWCNEAGTVYVSTVWVGYDANGCQPPHLFKTFVVDFDVHNRKPHIRRTFDSHSLPEAQAAHRQVVSMVKRGAL